MLNYMSSFLLWLINGVFALLPLTRLFKFKAMLLAFSGVNISRTARIVSSVRIVGTGLFEIGEDTFIGHRVFISCSPPGITIGSFVDIAPKVTIVNGTHELDMVGARTAGAGKCLPIIIGNGVWIGAAAVILPGVTIGEKAMIAAGAVVNKDVPAYSLAAGVPCRIIKHWNPTTKAWSSEDLS